MAKMDKDRYFDLMRETSEEVNLKIDGYLQKYRHNSELESVLKELPDRRKKKPQLRPLLMRLSYQICSGSYWKKISSVFASMELHNAYLYLHNWIFDNKNRIWDNSVSLARTKVSDLIIAASIFRELSEDALEEDLKFLDTERQERIRKTYRECLKQNYLGFYQDLHLTIDDITEFENDGSFLEIYERKSRNLSGEIYKLTAEVGAIVGNGSSEQIQALSEFGFCLGTGLHISNDLGDFALPVEDLDVFCKPYQDQLADIREDRLTLPIYHTLKYGNQQEKAALKEMVRNYNSSPEQMKRAAQAIISSGAYKASIKVAKKYYKRGKYVLRKHFDQTEDGDALSIMLSSIRTNKFLTNLKRLRD